MTIVARFTLTALLVAAGASPAAPGAFAQGLLGRPSPPQPQQKQGLEYFAGTWNFTWSGRESQLTPGPRSGTVTFTLAEAALRMDLKGTVDGGGPYQETGTLTWDADKKQLSMREQISGINVVSTGDWASPIGITVLSEPVTAKGQSVTLRRYYSILSASSFSVVEELSVGGGAFVRIGKGDFAKN